VRRATNDEQLLSYPTVVLSGIETQVLRRGGNCDEAGRERDQLVASDSLSSSVIGRWGWRTRRRAPAASTSRYQQPASGDREFVEPRCGEMEKGAGLRATSAASLSPPQYQKIVI
jgi:hypothetical protein